MQGGKRESGFNARTNVDDWVGLRTKAVVWQKKTKKAWGMRHRGIERAKKKPRRWPGLVVND
jgi:hypothetical protein